MNTIVEPKEHIARLWGKQKIKEGETYRMMRYVLKAEHEGTTLLHNVVTGQLVALEDAEAKVFNALPVTYSDKIEQLVSKHYLVPEGYDEHQQVVSLRKILRMLSVSKGEQSITKYSILPTTACNARCYYCFEQGVVPHTMNEETAGDIVDFINVMHGDGNKVYITWFGGEPTVASNRISQISKGLTEHGIEFESTIVTNGYLFDEALADTARGLWKLTSAQIAVDGTERNNNEIKSFVNAKDNPYHRVLRNIGLLLERSISVNLRMNFDLNNHEDFHGLLNDLKNMYGDKYTGKLHVFATPVLGKHRDHNGILNHGSDTWIDRKVSELSDLSRRYGFSQPTIKLPCLEYSSCSAGDDAYVLIGPSGHLGRCLECVDVSDAVGTIEAGVTDKALYDSWKDIADYKKCAKCCLYPWCVKMRHCSSGDRCYRLDDRKQCMHTMREKYVSYIERMDTNHVHV